MKKTILSLALIAGIALVSCNKEKVEDNFTTEVSTETETLRLPESDYQMNITEVLTKSSGDIYTSGIIEYKKNGSVLATFDFGTGLDDKKAKYIKDGSTYDCSLEKDGKDKKKYKKIIVEPIVKSDDCGYIISGIIKYYDYKSGDWLATVDFGDGTCDDIAVKTTKKGDYTFSVSTYY
jgi:uncharacterized lipoprotein NlpE involved in copper resistance